MARKVTDGTWRPDLPFNDHVGLKVTMRRAANLTPAGVLRVPLRFQVPPMNEFRRSWQFNWSTFDTVSGGQRSRPMGKQLLDLSIDTMFLDQLAADATEGVVVWEGRADPEKVLQELRFIAGVDDDGKGKAAPFRLTINQPAIWRKPVVDIVATLTSIQATQQAGEIGTEYTSVGFLEYPELEAGRQRRHQKPAKRHKLKADDTLYGLAKHYLHRASAWRDLAKANGITKVSPDSASELAAWAKKHHKTSLLIPKVELVARIVGEPIYSTGGAG